MKKTLEVGSKIFLEMAEGEPRQWGNWRFRIDTEQEDSILDMEFDRNWIAVNSIINGRGQHRMESNDRPTGVRPILPNDRINNMTISCLESGYGLDINGVDAFMSVPWRDVDNNNPDRAQVDGAIFPYRNATSAAKYVKIENLPNQLIRVKIE